MKTTKFTNEEFTIFQKVERACYEEDVVELIKAKKADGILPKGFRLTKKKLRAIVDRLMDYLSESDEFHFLLQNAVSEILEERG